MPVEHAWPNSRWWYGVITLNGKRLKFSLRIPFEGLPPSKTEGIPSAEYQKSRWRAEERLKEIEATIATASTEEEIRAIVAGAKSKDAPKAKGFSVVPASQGISFDELAESWRQLPSRNPTSESSHSDQVVSSIKRFVAYVRKHHAEIKTPAEVSEAIASAFMKSEEERGIAPKTYNERLKQLRSLFQRLRKRIGIADNPFEEIPTQKPKTINRRPFSPEELERILSVSKRHEFIRPIIVTGICTAMRRGDCCQLTWDAVDLEQGMIRTRTHKTGGFVKIPIFPILREVLETAQKTRRPNEPYVFPEQAMMYRSAPDSITYRVLKVLAEAGFSDEGSGRVRTQQRERGLRKASIYDFHAMRVTWVTLALMAGMPEKIVTMITGHKTVRVVLEHYFNPDDDDVREKVFSFMPALRDLGQTPKQAEVKGAASEKSLLRLTKLIQDRLTKMTADTWAKDREELLGVAKELSRGLAPSKRVAQKTPSSPLQAVA